MGAAESGTEKSPQRERLPRQGQATSGKPGKWQDQIHWFSGDVMFDGDVAPNPFTVVPHERALGHWQ